jgi:hypothetical protein
VAPMMRNGLLLSTRSLLAMGMLMWATRLIAGFSAVGLAGALPPALAAQRAQLQPARGPKRQAVGCPWSRLRCCSCSQAASAAVCAPCSP